MLGVCGVGWQPSDMHIYRGESLQLQQTPRHVARKRRGKALLLSALRASAGQSAGGSPAVHECGIS